MSTSPHRPHQQQLSLQSYDKKQLQQRKYFPSEKLSNSLPSLTMNQSTSNISGDPSHRVLTATNATVNDQTYQLVQPDLSNITAGGSYPQQALFSTSTLASNLSVRAAPLNRNDPDDVEIGRFSQISYEYKPNTVSNSASSAEIGTNSNGSNGSNKRKKWVLAAIGIVVCVALISFAVAILSFQVDTTRRLQELTAEAGLRSQNTRGAPTQATEIPTGAPLNNVAGVHSQYTGGAQQRNIPIHKFGATMDASQDQPLPSSQDILTSLNSATPLPTSTESATPTYSTPNVTDSAPAPAPSSENTTESPGDQPGNAVATVTTISTKTETATAIITIVVSTKPKSPPADSTSKDGKCKCFCSQVCKSALLSMTILPVPSSTSTHPPPPPPPPPSHPTPPPQNPIPTSPPAPPPTSPPAPSQTQPKPKPTPIPTLIPTPIPTTIYTLPTVSINKQTTGFSSLYIPPPILTV